MEHPTNNNNIDDLLRRRLQHAEVAPPAFVWPNVEAALRSRKRRFFLWFFLAAIAAAGIWSVWSRPGPLHIAENAAPAPERHEPAAQAVPAPVTNGPEQEHEPGKPAGHALSLPNETLAPAHSSKGSTAGAPIALQALPQSESIPASGNPDDTATGNLPGEIAQTSRSESIAQMSGTADLLPGMLGTLEGTGHELLLDRVQPLSVKKKAPKKCYDFHANRQAWLLDAYAGPSFVHKTLYSANPEFKDYIHDRLSTEQREPGFHAGLRASYLFAENFLVRTGVHYDQFTEKFEYIDPNYIKYTVIITQQYVHGEWVSVPDTVNVEYGANYVKTYNRFGLLDIPLQAALELRRGGSGVSLNLGGSVNVLFWKKGKMLGLDGKPVSFTPDQHQLEVFKPRIGLSLLGSIQWFYHIGPQTRLFAEPYYRYVLQPVSKAGYPVEQSYGIGGIRIGVTRIFEKK